ncbi:MAG: hypothetical protein U1F76_16820 [Candidatus Competibacteraceae bacterium]
MPQDELLRWKIANLQTLWKHLTEKLTGLQHDKILEPRSDEKLRIGRLIDETEKERDEVEHKMAYLESRLQEVIESDRVVVAKNTNDENNPYDPWTPVTPPRFLGRDSLLRRLETALEEGRSLSLVGDWRIGKSSVLATWEQQAQAKGRLVRCVSGEGAEGTTPGAFVGAVTGLPSPDNPEQAADVLTRWAENAGRPGLPPLILMDEADGLFVRLDHRLFERMRGMLGRICLVVASRKEIDQICQAMGRTSPFLNRLELAWLGLLEPEAAEALIRWGERYFQPDDAELMRTWAGRHPFYLQLLGHHLVDIRRNGEPVEEALDRFHAEARVRLRELWRVLDERDRQALRDGLGGIPIKRRSLRVRGLVTEQGQLFGEVLAEWLREEL